MNDQLNNMSIVDVVLFYCKSSKPCKDIIELINDLKIKVSFVSLDTRANRDLAMNGDNFQIRRVPSIMVVKTDGNGEIYEGNDAVNWVYSIVQHTKLHHENQNHPQKRSRPSILQSPEENEQNIDLPDVEDGVIIKSEEEPYTPLQAQKSSSCSNDNIMDLARQMEKDRKDLYDRPI